MKRSGKSNEQVQKFPKTRINDQTGEEIDARAGRSGFDCFDHLARIVHHLFGNADQLPILGLLLMSALGGAHALDRLHAAASAAGAVGKALYSVGKFPWRSSMRRVMVRTESHSRVASVG